jgi:hypothetical protein
MTTAKNAEVCRGSIQLYGNMVGMEEFKKKPSLKNAGNILGW